MTNTANAVYCHVQVSFTGPLEASQCRNRAAAIIFVTDTILANIESILARYDPMV